MLGLGTAESAIADYEEEASQPTFWEDAARAQATMTALERAKGAVQRAAGWRAALDDAAAALEMAHELCDANHGGDWDAFEADPEGVELRAEASALLGGLEKDLSAWRLEALMSGPYDAQDCRLTFQAGTGGTDAQDWTLMLVRMYQRWAQRRGFTVKTVEMSEADDFGIRSAELLVCGPNAYGLLKGEKGTHRLVRQSPFNKDAKRQTSFAAVEALPVLGDSTDAAMDSLTKEIPPADLDESFIRCGGKGGQNVNKVESGVVLKHVPTGVSVKCTEERTQGLNRKIALARLKEKLTVIALEQQAEDWAAIRGDAVDADFGQQIRNYVLHPYKMAKDLRSGWETTAVGALLEGGDEMDDCLAAYLDHKARAESEAAR